MKDTTEITLQNGPAGVKEMDKHLKLHRLHVEDHPCAFYDITLGDNAKNHPPSMPVIFQHGPPAEVGVNGITDEILLAIVIDRLQIFQEGAYACQQNADCLKHLRAALELKHYRSIDRHNKGIEGEHLITGEKGERAFQMLCTISHGINAYGVKTPAFQDIPEIIRGAWRAVEIMSEIATVPETLWTSYAEFVGWVTHRGDPLPRWEEMETKQKDNWIELHKQLKACNPNPTNV